MKISNYLKEIGIRISVVDKDERICFEFLKGRAVDNKKAMRIFIIYMVVIIGLLIIAL